MNPAGLTQLPAAVRVEGKCVIYPERRRVLMQGKLKAAGDALDVLLIALADDEAAQLQAGAALALGYTTEARRHLTLAQQSLQRGRAHYRAVHDQG